MLLCDGFALISSFLVWTTWVITGVYSDCTMTGLIMTCVL